MKDLFEKLLGSQPHNIMLILGAIFIALGALGGIPLNSSVQVVDDLGRNLLFAVGALLLVVALILIFRMTASVGIPRNKNYGFTLSFPKSSEDGKPVQVVGELPEFGGSYKNRNFGKYEFRLVIFDQSRNRFWPHEPSKINWGENGRWNATVFFQNVNDEKTIIAVLVPPSGVKLFDYFLQNANKTERAAVQGSLPEDIIKIGEIKAKRVA